MIITWYGQSCFKVQSGEIVIAIDPMLRGTNVSSPRFRTDITLVTQPWVEVGKEAMGSETLLISSTGEYEVKGVTILGIATLGDKEGGKKYGMNIMYRFCLEEIHFLHMGYFGEENLRPETQDAIGDVDVLFVPVDGEVGSTYAAKLVRQIEPAIAIPLLNGRAANGKVAGAIDAFLKEMDLSNSTEERLVIQKKDVKMEGATRIVPLKSQ